MNCRSTVKQKEKGIALVITLVMLAVVTLMAIVFLAVTRRERSSVIVTQETAIAKDMADAALERVKTEVLARMNSSGSRLNYDIFNSQAYYHPNWFNAGLAPTNVNVGPPWQWLSLNNAEYLELLSNLQYDPAVPVFIETNRNGLGDLRFYLDFNRNRQFETNGTWPVRDLNNNPILDANRNIITNHFVGDPEWIGVLERPDLPHSETNRFVGRLAYLVLPAGKTLDLNFIHNQVNGTEDRLDITTTGNSFSRSQGVGPWEINLAAFFRELNTNNYAWFPASYQFGLQPSGFFQASGEAFDDARTLLSYRYPRRSFLEPMRNTLVRDNLLNPAQDPTRFASIHEANFVQDFSARPVVSISSGQLRPFFTPGILPDNEAGQSGTRGWPGSLNTNAFTDIQQLFSIDATSPNFVQRLTTPGLRAADGGSGTSGNSSYDRYTFYRLASQLGTDSKPWLDGKVHLNFKNPVGQITNVTERWIDGTNGLVFFLTAAQRMLEASVEGRVVISNRQQELRFNRPMYTPSGNPNAPVPTEYKIIGDTLVRSDFNITNIQVYGVSPRMPPGTVINEYTPTIHRILQLAANIYDSMTNRPFSLPSTFMPVFTNKLTNIVVSGFVELGGNDSVFPVLRAPDVLARQWRTFEDVFTNRVNSSLSIYNFYGQHIVIGAKKGHPNLNELALNSTVEFSRKLRLTKSDPSSTNITATNQMFLVGLQQRWGMEAWNSYRATNNRPMTIDGEVFSTVALRDGTNIYDPPVFRTNFTSANRFTAATDWSGVDLRFPQRTNSFRVLIDHLRTLFEDRPYSATTLTGGTIPPGPARFRNPTDYTSVVEQPPNFLLYTTNRVKYWVIDDNTGRLVDFISFDRLVTEMDLRAELRKTNNLATSASRNPQQKPTALDYWNTNLVNGGPVTVGMTNQLAVSAGLVDEPEWNSYRSNLPNKEGEISKFRVFIGLPPRTGVDTNVANYGFSHQAPFTPTRQVIQRLSWQVNDPLVHYMAEDLRRDRANEGPESFDVPLNRDTNWNIGKLNFARYHPWKGVTSDSDTTDRFSWNWGLMDPDIRSSDDWDFSPRATNVYQFPNIGVLGQVHRGTPWQTIYLKSFYRNMGNGVFRTNSPSLWYDWAGSVGTHPMRDWRLLDVFTTALNENSARGLLSVNQTNAAAWSAVLSGALAPKSTVDYNTALGKRTTGTDPNTSYIADVIQPGSREISAIVASISQARTNQYSIIRNPNPNANQNAPYIGILLTNTLSGRLANTFRSMGDILAAPGLSVESPFLAQGNEQVQAVWTDRAVEYIPQQILSLLQADDPRFVVYAFGQSLKPAPRSLTTDPNYYHMCTNYQITGEVITKTTFRVEGQPRDTSNPLRAVIEKYEVVPPLE
ncbi:MAG TPA: hypothetical protein VF773_16910 [Verrucomicrobiae bacterium]